MSAGERWYARERLGGLRRFAAAITLLTLLGHTVLGFEQAPLQPLVALAVAYGTELSLEAVGAWADRRRPAFRGGLGALVTFLLPAHITGLAVAMLLYPGERLGPMAFGACAAIASKSVFRVRVGSGRRHWLNPSNFGIALTLLLFHWVGIAPPYMFTAGLGPLGDWALPALIVVVGTVLNARYTRRLPLIGAWLAGFVLQAWLRQQLLGSRFLPGLMPMSGMAFLLFTFYMVTDPATTPTRRWAQVAFGGGVAFFYGVLMALHVVFGLFFALALTSLVRGASLYGLELRAHLAAAGARLATVTLQPHTTAAAPAATGSPGRPRAAAEPALKTEEVG